jgi:hypothetical protein
MWVLAKVLADHFAKEKDVPYGGIQESPSGKEIIDVSYSDGTGKIVNVLLCCGHRYP